MKLILKFGTSKDIWNQKYIKVTIVSKMLPNVISMLYDKHQIKFQTKCHVLFLYYSESMQNLTCHPTKFLITCWHKSVEILFFFNHLWRFYERMESNDLCARGMHSIVKQNITCETKENLLFLSSITKMGQNFINLFFHEQIYNLSITQQKIITKFDNIF